MAIPLEAECRAAITQSFQLLSERLTAELRSILGAAYPPSTYLFWFVYDSPHFDDSFPITFCQMDRSGQSEQVRRLLPEVAYAVPSTIIYDPRYEAADLDTWVLASEVLVPWFADCWQAAGGQQSRWPGFLAHHDSSFSFDLTVRRELRSPEPRYPGT